MDILIIQILVFLAVLLGVLGLNAVIRGEKQGPGDKDRPWFFRTFARELAAIGELIGPRLDRSFPSQAKQIARDLTAADFDSHVSVRDVRGAQGFAALGLGLSAGTLVLVLNGPLSIAVALALGAVGFVWPALWLKSAASNRRDAISKELPYAIDLISVAMQAGQDFGAAVRQFVKEGVRGPLLQEFALMLRETDLGKARIEALKSMAARTQLDEFQAIVTAIVQSTELGASVTVALKVQAEEARRSRFHRAERKAARAPSLMVLPVALFILPAVFIVILTPVLIRILNTLETMR